MKRRNFLKLVGATLLLPYVEPLTRLIPPLHRRATVWTLFEETLREGYIEVVCSMMDEDDAVFRLIGERKR